MRSLLHFFFVIVLLLCSFLADAQNWCGALHASPLPEKPASLDRPKTEITIPVVVHIVWRTEDEQESRERVQSQIDVLNEDFRALNADLADVYPFFQSRTADMEINFVLATEDPMGQPHSGIVERPTTETNLTEFVGGRRRLCYNDLGGSTAWCTACYLNIWVADLDLDQVAGIGIFPTDVASGEVPAAEDGVYIQHDRFGRGGGLEAPYNLGRTCTHEVGHYLNLFHPWGANTPPVDCVPNVCCVDPAYDDFVDDTPFQILTYLGECPGSTVESCQQNDGPDNVQNFMGFSPDNCSLMFTEGQKTRVWEALQAYRPGFLSDDCLSTCMVSTEDEPTPVENLLLVRQLIPGQYYTEILQTNVNWELFGGDGKLLSSGYQEFPGAVSVNYEGLPAGLYYLRAQRGDDWQVAKLLIARN